MGGEWRGRSLPLSARDIVFWEKADQEIEANRCGDAIIRVVNDSGQPLKGVPVRFEQRQHAFRFGVHYPYHPETFDLLQQAGINAATLWLGWADVQPQRGVYNLDTLDRVWNPAALHQRGLRLTAHALNWFKPGWRVLPSYLLETPLGQLPHLVYEHTKCLARHWSPYIETFELVNEPFWVEAQAIPLGKEDLVRICHAAALAVGDVLPEVRLEVNFAEVSRLPSYRIHPLEFLQALAEADVPYDSIGLQAFENAYSVTTPPTYYRSKTLSGLAQALRPYAGLSKPLHISALAVPSGPPANKPPAAFKPPYGPWDEPTQAHYLDAAYTLLFAQPQVQGITWWCPVDGRLAYIQCGGLLHEDLTPKPSYDALRQWMIRHTTSGQMPTDIEGKAVISGYAGEYEVSIGVGSMSRRSTQTIEAGVVREQTVVLAYHP